MFLPPMSSKSIFEDNPDEKLSSSEMNFTKNFGEFSTNSSEVFNQAWNFDGNDENIDINNTLKAFWLSLNRPPSMMISSPSFTNESHPIDTSEQFNETNSVSVYNTAAEDDIFVNSSHSMNSTSSTGGKTATGEFYYDLFTVIIIIVIYSLIIIVSLSGNSLVLKIILAKKKMQTTTNILIAWLAVSDLLTTTLNIPFNVARFLAMNYPFPALFCKLVPFIQVMCVYVSTFTMGVIAVHRYLTVTSTSRTSITPIPVGGGSGSTGGGHGGMVLIRPLLLHGSLCLCAIMTIVWVVAGLLATPHSMFNQIVYVPYNNVPYARCRAEYPKVNFNFRFLLSVEAFLTQYLIPLGLICFLYIKIGFVVAKQGRVAQKANSKRRMEQDSARRRRLTMLILVVLVFGLCWLPLNTYHLLVDFHIIRSNFTVFLFCHWVAMSSVCWNPFIYCWLNESFRKGATKMIIYLCCCCFPRMRRQLLIKRRCSVPGQPPSTTTNNSTSITHATTSSAVENHNHQNRQRDSIEMTKKSSNQNNSTNHSTSSNNNVDDNKKNDTRRKSSCISTSTASSYGPGNFNNIQTKARTISSPPTKVEIAIVNDNDDKTIKNKTSHRNKNRKFQKLRSLSFRNKSLSKNQQSNSKQNKQKAKPSGKNKCPQESVVIIMNTPNDKIKQIEQSVDEDPIGNNSMKQTSSSMNDDHKICNSKNTSDINSICPPLTQPTSSKLSAVDTKQSEPHPLLTDIATTSAIKTTSV